MPAPIAAPMLNAMRSIHAREIEYHANAEISAVDIGRRRLSTSMGDVAFTEANLVLPMRAPALIRQAGLGERWAAIKLPSFQSQADEKIHIVGDAQGTPLPKSGHVAFGAGVQVAQEIVKRIAGQAVPALAAGASTSLPGGICWASVTHDEAIMINVGASVGAEGPPKLSFSVDPAHNAASGKGAVDWGRMMWGHMLG